MIDCRNIAFSPELSQERIARAQEILGTKEAERILCFGSFLFGANRTEISQTLGLAPGSVRSIIRAVHQHGLPAFEDRRRATSSFRPPVQPELPSPRVQITEQEVIVDFGAPEKALRISRRNPLQLRAILLSMLNSGLLAKREVADLLELTPEHTGNLARKLEEEDLSALIDKRKGQQRDYRVTPEVKGKLIQEYVSEVAVQGKATSVQLSEDLSKHHQLYLPERTIRHHVQKLGLAAIEPDLHELLTNLKKTPPLDA
ncbi:MAG: hypothetical protein ACE5FH_12425 [Candidatus Zixiibacteriota bacterium]